MAGYIGSKSSVTLVDGYTEAEADAEFVTKTGDTMSGNLDVTGTVTSDGLTVDGIATFNAPNSIIRIMESDTTDTNTQIQNNGGDLHIQTVVDNLSSSKNRISLDHSTGDISFYEDTGTTAKFFWDSSAESLGIGTSSPNDKVDISGSTGEGYRLTDGTHTGVFRSISGGTILKTTTNHALMLGTNDTERMRINSSGRVLVGKTASGMTSNGVELRTGVTNDYAFTATSLNQPVLLLNRQTDDGMIIRMRQANSDIGSIGNSGNYMYLASLGPFSRGVKITDNFIPADTNGNNNDNAMDLGGSSVRWDDVYATNGTIQTSDFNEKQDIASLTATEMLVGKRISALFKTFRWKDSVAENGDNARTHTGVIAQDVQAAFTAEGLDAGDYSLFISTTWWEHDVDVPAVEAVAEVLDEDGNVTTEAVEAVDAYTRTDTYDTEAEAPEGATSKTRMGIRYPELLSFVAAYNEQRFASIEARLTALEG